MVSTTFNESGDIRTARIGLLMYWMFFILFGFFMQSYVYTSQASLGLNVILKKYVRTKEILINSMIWSLLLQGILLIVGIIFIT